jgi:glycyl-tRNA synthetase beta subunit
VSASLAANRLQADGVVETYSTPRRLTARIARVAERQTDLEELITGPPVSAALGRDGQPSPAAAGFARKHGVEVADLEQAETPAARTWRIAGGNAAGRRWTCCRPCSRPCCAS